MYITLFNQYILVFDYNQSSFFFFDSIINCQFGYCMCIYLTVLLKYSRCVSLSLISLNSFCFRV